MRYNVFIPAAALALMIVTPLVAHAQYAYVGTYPPNGEGIYRFEVNPTEGVLSNKTLVSRLASPAQLILDTRGKTLYAASETEQGRVVAYSIAGDGGLTMLNQVSSQGAGPVNLSLTPDGRFLLVANYTGGSVAVLPVLSDGRLAEASDFRQHQGPTGAARPAAAVEGSFAISDHNGPHAHMIASDPSGKFVFATDLGLDRIWQYRLSHDGKLQANQPAWIAASSAGAGPRHDVWTRGDYTRTLTLSADGKTLYALNQRSDNITRFRVDTASGVLTFSGDYTAIGAPSQMVLTP